VGEKSVVDRILSVRVEVDESGRNDQAFDVDGVASGGHRGRHGDDTASTDRDRAYGIEIGLGIE
jgi:hypothetical protein